MVAKGHFILRSYAKPPVTAGRYVLHGEQAVTGLPIAPYDGEVHVASPRYVMPPDQILSTFPPAMAEGDFGGRLPQIVLKRRTMPWERRPDPARPADEDPPVPWLALVVIADGEGSVSSEPRPVAECVTPGRPPLPDPADADSATGYYLSVTETVVQKVFPTIEDLPLLVHVREVDVRDTELGAGDDDGFLAVVLANRLPIAVPTVDADGATVSKPVKYLACLVNLEGQLDVLPTTQVTDDFLVLTEAVQDVRSLALAGGSGHPDHYAMGTGVNVHASVLGAVGTPAAVDGAGAAGAVGAGALAAAVAPFAAAAPAPVHAAAQWSAVAAAPVNAPAAHGTASIRREMAGGFSLDFERFVLEKTYRFPVLAHWSFTSVNEGDFRSLVQALDVGLVGTAFGTVRDATGEHDHVPDPKDPPRPTPPEVAATGHVALPHTTRRGDPAQAWFRGPLSPHPTDRDPATEPPAHVSDELRTVTPDGREDVSLAAAFEIGRLLALSQPSLLNALTRWRRDQFGAARAARVGELLAERTRFDTGAAGRGTLGRALGLEVLVRSVGDGVAGGAGALGPSRPLVDPGRPIDGAGALDQSVAAGLGLDLEQLKAAAGERGMAYALAVTPPAVAQVDGVAPAGLRAALASEVTRLAAAAAPSFRPGLQGAAAAGGDADARRARRARRADRRRRPARVRRPRRRRGGPAMRFEAFDAKAALEIQSYAAAVADQNLVERDPDDGDHVVPGSVRRALAELRLLHDVPFSYLVADASLLPPESIRFFYLDRNWTDALVQGVLSVGTFTAADRTQLEALYPIVRREVDEAERAIRRPGEEARLTGEGGTVTGFLLRSKVVSGWPGLHVRAYRTDRQQDADIIPESDPDRLKVLRLERLAPAVLLVLFDGVPAVVHVEEPRQGIQFGAIRPVGQPLSTERRVPLRNAATGADLEPERDVVVPFRRGAAGVINLHKLRERMVAVPASGVGAAVEANEFALEMLRFPFRQVFGDPANEPGEQLRDVFRPTLGFAELLNAFAKAMPR